MHGEDGRHSNCQEGVSRPKILCHWEAEVNRLGKKEISASLIQHRHDDAGREGLQGQGGWLINFGESDREAGAGIGGCLDREIVPGKGQEGGVADWGVDPCSRTKIIHSSDLDEVRFDQRGEQEDNL